MDKQGTFNAQLYNTNAEIAEAFIPFIEAHTSLRRNGAPLPVIIDAAFSYEAAFYLRLQEAAGIYQARLGFRKDADADAKARGRIIFNHDIGYDATRIASVFLHELVHWMQDINGTSQRVEHMADHGPLEFEAYAVQAAFLREHGLDPYADFPEVFSVIESNYGKPGSPAPLFCRIAKTFGLDGKRYSLDGVPTGQIEWLVGQLHVTTTEAEIEADFRTRAAPPAPLGQFKSIQRLADAIVAYAIKTHRANQKLYRYVQRGQACRIADSTRLYHWTRVGHGWYPGDIFAVGNSPDEARTNVLAEMHAHILFHTGSQFERSEAAKGVQSRIDDLRDDATAFEAEIRAALLGEPAVLAPWARLSQITSACD